MQLNYSKEWLCGTAINNASLRESVLLPRHHVAKFSFTHDRMTQTFTMNFQYHKMSNQNLYQ